MDAPGDKPSIADFELLCSIGSGGYGDVWLARAVTGVFRAIKVVQRCRFADARPYEREFKGVRAYAAVAAREPSQLALLHVACDPAGAFFYYVMELADDCRAGREIDPARYRPRTLQEVRALAPRPVDEVVGLGVQLARALATLHASGLVHRDVKPSNIVFVGGVPKLADPGLVAPVRADMTCLGTVGFMPPEGSGAPGADVFALGRVLYELATGHDRGAWPRLPEHFASKPERRAYFELNEVLLRACAADPAERFSDGQGLLDELLLLQAGKSVRRLRAAERRLGRTLRVAALLAVAAAVAGTGMWLERQRAARETALRRRAEAELQAVTQRSLYAATLVRARNAIDEETFGEARALLAGDGARPPPGDGRGIEWSVLAGLAQGDAATVLHAGPSPVADLCADRLRRSLVAIDEAGTLFFLAPGAAGSRSLGTGYNLLGGFTADSRHVVAQAKDDGSFVWVAVADGTRIRRHAAPRGALLLGLDHADRPVAVLNEPDTAIVVCAGAAAEVVRRFPVATAPGQPAWTLSYRAVSRGGDRAILIFMQSRGDDVRWRVQALDLLRERVVFDGPSPGGLPTGGFLPEAAGTFLVATGLLGELHRLTDGATGWTRVGQLGGETTALAERSGERAGWLRAGWSPVIVAYDSAGAVARDRWRGHGGRIVALLAGASTDEFFSASTDGTVRRWPFPVQPTTPEWSALNTDGKEFTMIPAPDGAGLLLPRDGGSAALLEVDSWHPAVFWPAVRRGVAWIGEHVWTVSPEGTSVDRWRVRADGSRALERRHVASTDAQWLHPTVSPDARWLAAGTPDGKLVLWSQAAEEAPREIAAHGDASWGFAFTPDGSRVWSAGFDGSLVAVETATGRVVHRLPLVDHASGLAVSPDGTTLALALVTGRLELRSAVTGELRAASTVGTGFVYTACFSPDGTRVLVGGSSGNVSIVSTRDGSTLATVRAPTDAAIGRIAVDPRGRWLAIATTTGRVFRWNLKSSGD